MTREELWELIEESRANHGIATDQMVDDLTLKLTQRGIDDCIAFHNHLWCLLAESYRWDLWAVAGIINGGCSDDAFLYFRAWLVAQGRERFEAALATPEIIGEWAEDGDRVSFELLLTAADDAHETLTGTGIIGAVSQPKKHPSKPFGNRLDDAELPMLFPTLVRKFNYSL